MAGQQGAPPGLLDRTVPIKVPNGLAGRVRACCGASTATVLARRSLRRSSASRLRCGGKDGRRQGQPGMGGGSGEASTQGMARGHGRANGRGDAWAREASTQEHLARLQEEEG